MESRSITFWLVSVMLAGSVAAQLDTDAPWPRWAHDNYSSGRAVKTLTSPAPEGTVLWTFQGTIPAPFRTAEYTDHGVVLAKDGLLYFTTSRGRLFCLSSGVPLAGWSPPYDTGIDDDCTAPTIVKYIPADPGLAATGSVQGYAVVFGCNSTLF